MTFVKIIGVAVLIMTLCTGTYAQKTILNSSEIPPEIVSYINQNFKNNRIKKSIKDVDNNKTEYEIKLSKGLEIEFDEAFIVKEIEWKKGVPLNLIPLKIANYVQSHFPDLKVLQWKLNTEGQKIELNNKYEIQFNVNGSFIKTEIK